MTIAVDLGCKATKQSNKTNKSHFIRSVMRVNKGIILRRTHVEGFDIFNFINVISHFVLTTLSKILFR